MTFALKSVQHALFKDRVARTRAAFRAACAPFYEEIAALEKEAAIPANSSSFPMVPRGSRVEGLCMMYCCFPRHESPLRTPVASALRWPAIFPDRHARNRTHLSRSLGKRRGRHSIGLDSRAHGLVRRFRMGRTPQVPPNSNRLGSGCWKDLRMPRATGSALVQR